MTYAELVAEIEARGYRFPKNLHRDTWRGFLGFEPGMTGSPGHRTYTTRHMRMILAWIRVMELTGHQFSGAPPRTVRNAARMLAAAPEGYVYISDGRVGWSLVPPLQALRHGAACWPVQR